MKLDFFHQGLRSLARDWRAGELRLLVLSVVLAVTALTAVAFFANRISLGLERDAGALLGGDAVVVSDRDTPAWIIKAAQREGLRGVKTSQFPTMAQAGSGDAAVSRLVALKAVAAGYPLRGAIRLKQAPLRSDSPTARSEPNETPSINPIPASGEIWVDAPLLDALGAQEGDSLQLGEAKLRIAAVIANEPDRGAGFMNFAPRVLMNDADLLATQLVQPASRITWRYAVVGEAPNVKRFRELVEQRIKAEAASVEMRGLRVESLESGRPEMRQTLDRAEKFLKLVALLTALLSAVAVAIACRGFAQRRLDDCAMLRVLGQSQRNIALSYAVEFCTIGLLASLTGVLGGYALHHLFATLAQGLITGLAGTSLPAPSLWPVLLGLGTGLLLTLTFGLPPVLQLSQVPALRVMRRDVGQLRGASLGVLGLGSAGFAALLLVVSADTKMGSLAVGGFAAAVCVFALLAWLAVWLLRRWVSDHAPQALRLATRQIAARPALVVVQVSALAVGLLALALLVLLRTDLIQSWRNATPANAPNRFVINIQPDQADAFQKALRDGSVSSYDWYPMIRGRLIAINGKPITPESYAEDRAKRLVDREFNLSYAGATPPHNPVTAGQWTNEEAGAVSVEVGIAKTLGLKLGDTLSFDIAGFTSESRITSLRKVDWASMRVNFFVMYPRSTMPTNEPWPTTFISAFRAPEAKGFDNALVRQFPNITLVNTAATLQQVQHVLGQVISAVEYLFAFALAAGLLVLVATVNATRGERTREFAIMRALGASSALLARVQRIELAGVGFLSGVLAGAVALVISWGLAKYAFEFDWTPRLWVVLVCGAAGALLALLAGHYALRQVLQTPVVSTLRDASV
jgi:putative ABC transport system permease protein